MEKIIAAPKATRMNILLVMAFFLLPDGLYGQEPDVKLYPYCYESRPEIASPVFINDSVEVVLVVTKENKYALVPVTVENGKPLLYSYKVGTFMGKDQQLLIDRGDFPELAETGLHSRERLDHLTMITGIPLNTINCTARPEAYSTTGFIAEDEDLITVLRADNRTVRNMGLTHPQMARPLFHVWNLILMEYELGNWVRHYDNIRQISYNDHLLNFEASGSKGWQISIFFDEIQGRHNIHIDRTLTAGEEEYINSMYVNLGPEKMKKMRHMLSNLDFSEMLPYYVMRYGFYEGHTGYRADPVAVAFVFGLRSIDEIDKSVGGELYSYLTGHFILE
ncbi:MAG: hypothetical protein RBT02_06925 [Bacteroidales bacterium]|jgi:hypothetical protein|nr:hypothetical protein [Bacteroidales bacterium]